MSVRTVINQSINLFWTALCFVPILSFWIHTGPNGWLIVFLVTSVAAMFLPERFLKCLRISKHKHVYEKLGVRNITKFVQDGDWRWGNGISRDQGRLKGRGSLQAYLKTIDMYERYHWGCLLFFSQTNVYGISGGTLWWLTGILTANIIYNVLPMLLQQYNRIRIQTLLSHSH